VRAFKGWKERFVAAAQRGSCVGAVIPRGRAANLFGRVHGGGGQSNQRDRALVQIGRDPGSFFNAKTVRGAGSERNGHLLKAVAEKPTDIGGYHAATNSPG